MWVIGARYRLKGVGRPVVAHLRTTLCCLQKLQGNFKEHCVRRMLNLDVWNTQCLRRIINLDIGKTKVMFFERNGV